MSYRDYAQSRDLEEIVYRLDFSFDAIIMTAMRKADDDNAKALRKAFPHQWYELLERYNAPGGRLEGDLD